MLDCSGSGSGMAPARQWEGIMGIRETNTQSDSRRETLLVAERRRRVCAWVQRHGAANVTQLAQTLDVGANTIRRDLAILAKEGKLIRSHGGAVANEPAFTRMPYVHDTPVHKASA